MTGLLVAFDPGDVHVGMALFSPEGGPASSKGWRCLYAIEVTPERAADDLADLMLQNKVTDVAIEQWLLYPDKAAQQAGSEMLSSQLIGVLKYIVRLNNRHAAAHLIIQAGGSRCSCSPDRKIEVQSINLALYPSDSKTTAASLCKRRKIKSKAKQAGTNTAGDHPLDAELIGWIHLFQAYKI